MGRRGWSEACCWQETSSGSYPWQPLQALLPKGTCWDSTSLLQQGSSWTVPMSPCSLAARMGREEPLEPSPCTGCARKTPLLSGLLFMRQHLHPSTGALPTPPARPRSARPVPPAPVPCPQPHAPAHHHGGHSPLLHLLLCDCKRKREKREKERQEFSAFLQ